MATLARVESFVPVAFGFPGCGWVEFGGLNLAVSAGDLPACHHTHVTNPKTKSATSHRKELLLCLRERGG